MGELKPAAAPTAEPPPTPGADPRPAGRVSVDLGELFSRYGLLLTWALVIAGFSIAEPNVFPTSTNVANILGSQAALLILTMGMIVPLTVGEYDLSVSGVLSISLVLVGYLDVTQGWPIEAAVAVALCTGLAVGALNALVIVRIGVNSLVATLGMTTLLMGVTLGISNLTVAGISPALTDLVRTKLFGIQLAFYYGLVLTALCWYLLRFTPLGRQMLFTGASREVARLSGVRVDRIRAGSLVVSSFVAALAGVVLAGVLGAADPSTASGYLLPPFAAAFLGATAITPGRFNPWGSFIAVYFLVTGITGLQIVGLSGWIEQVFYGGALILAVTLSRLAAARFAHS